MKQKLRLGECYALIQHKLKQFGIPYIGLLAAATIMCSEAVQQVSAQEAEPAATAIASAPVDLVSMGVQIGDRLPDHTLTDVHNFHTRRANLSDFRGKLLILDFWATWCSPCVAMIPTIDSLQKEFDAEVQFLSVSYQTAREISAFLAKYEKQRGDRSEIPWIAGDTVLHGCFPHKTLPHYVWIGPEGTVRAITDNDAINAENIKAALNGIFPSETKRDYFAAFDRDKPFLVNGNGGDGQNLIFHSVLTSYTEGLTAGRTITKRDATQPRKISLRNSGLLNLFGVAHLDYGYFGANRIRLLVGDTSRLVWDQGTGLDYSEWKRQGNGYCYEIIVPPVATDSIYVYMREDMRRLFPQYRISLPEREVTCYALVKHGDSGKGLESSGGTPAILADRFGCRITNSHLASWIYQLNVLYMQDSPWPLVDDTGITHPVDLQIAANMNDIRQLNAALAEYGLMFVKTTLTLSVLQIEDRNQNLTK